MINNNKIALLGLALLPFAIGEPTPLRPKPRGEMEDTSADANLEDTRHLKMMMMMMGKKKRNKNKEPSGEDGLFIGEQAQDYYDGKGKGKGKGGGMMMMMKKKKSSKGKGGGKSSEYYDDYYDYDDYYKYHPPTDDYHPPAATFIQTLGCYADALDDGIPCIYSHNPDAQVTYQLLDECRWIVTEDAVLTVQYFDLEEGYDILTVGGVQFTATGEGLDGAPVFAGDEIVFSSDFMNPTIPPAGFKVCLANPSQW